MNLSRKILVVHSDPLPRRRLALVLVEAGYDVRPFGSSEAALKSARSEWFDLALIDYALPGGEGFGFAGLLREAQPTLPVIMLLPQLELPLIIQGIRLGLTDVLASETDPRPVLRRVHALLRPGSPAGPELTPAELAEVDAVLARYDEETGTADGDPLPDAMEPLRQQLAQAMRARVELEAEVERLSAQKAAAEQELHSLLAQQSQNVRVQAELAELRLQRDQAAAAQASVDASARQLDHTRAELEAERQALEQEKASRPPMAVQRDPLELERAHLTALREDLREEENRLREESARVRQEATQLAQERRRWHEELDQLREREENLRAYEQRLRAQQAELERERVALAANVRPEPAAAHATAPGETRSRRGDPLDELIQRDVKLRAEWEKVHRANELLEAERAVFRDERMALRDLEQTIRQREQRLRELEAQVAAHEVIKRHLPPPPPPGRGTGPNGDAAGGGVLKALTRAPFSIWSKGGS